MYESNIKSEYRKFSKDRFCQGDFLQDITIFLGSPASNQDADELNFQYAVILSQDCDLERDYIERNKKESNDKYLKTILICPAYPSSKFFEGAHITGWTMKIPSKKQVSNNNLSRYHFLKEDMELKIPESVIDFKHFVTAPRDILYDLKDSSYLGTINELFRENLSQRFANYLSRIGVPELEIVRIGEKVVRD
jgi:hypothetical protein